MKGILFVNQYILNVSVSEHVILLQMVRSLEILHRIKIFSYG